MLKAPRRNPGRWAGAYHMLARRYQDYSRAVLKASRRKRRRGVDVDAQDSAEGTAWALHWATLGKNKLRDPRGQYGKRTRIDSLRDAEIFRMRGPRGQRPHPLENVLLRAYKLNVRVEIEAKTRFSPRYVRSLRAKNFIQEMDAKGLIQVKTLAWMGAPNGGPSRLEPWHDEGFTTILSFTGFGRRRGVSKSKAWPVTDYVRGRAKWIP